MIRLATAVLLLALSAAVAQSAPATWSLSRASAGIDAKAAIWNQEGEESSHFLPGAYLSYSAASNLSLALTYEREFATNLSVAQAGARIRVLDTTRGDIAGAVNAVFYGDEGAAGIKKPTSYNVGVNGSWSAIRGKNGRTSVWAIAQASWDPQNDIQVIRAGLRLQVFGGAPQFVGPEETQ